MTDQHRIRQLKESIFTTTSLHAYYAKRREQVWLDAQRGKRDAAKRQADEVYAKAVATHQEAQIKFDVVDRDLRMAKKELHALTEGKKLEQVKKLAAQIAALEKMQNEINA